MPRTVTSQSAAMPSFVRSRRTCVSTVRERTSASYPQTSASSASRERTLPRARTKTLGERTTGRVELQPLFARAFGYFWLLLAAGLSPGIPSRAL